MAKADIDLLQLDDLVPAAKAIARGDDPPRTWTAPDDHVIAWYKAYLRCRYTHDGDGNRREQFVAISQMADDLWHAHILRTVRYTNDTNRIFGHYLHHTPFERATKVTPQFRADKREYENECQRAVANLRAGSTGGPGAARAAASLATAAAGSVPPPPGVPPDVVHLCG